MCFLFFVSILVLVIIVFDDSQLLSNGLDVVDDLDLDQVEAHGDHGDPEEQVDGAEGDPKSHQSSRNV